MIYDIFIIGGGINGAGIACDAAGRGLSVYLCEMNDFASGTSSKSSQLIHGGLRYLESFEFKLVRESLKERKVLLHKAPHLVKPLPFIMPYNTKVRSTWLLKCGLWIYDYLAKKNLPKATTQLSVDEITPLNSLFQRGIKYYDCWVDDARLVINNLQQARKLGAKLNNYHECIAINPKEHYWEISVRNKKNNQVRVVKSKVLINAAGPWVDKLNSKLGQKEQLSLIQGSHIVINKWYKGKHAYILQNDDKRAIFVIPVDDSVIIGTTDKVYQGDLSKVIISEEEIAYLLAVVNHYFDCTLDSTDIIHTYSGVRALYNNRKQNISKITRDYRVEHNIISNLPYVSILGGKMTTYRCLAEETLSILSPYFPNMKPAWTKNKRFPSANFDKIENLNHALKNQYDFIPDEILSIYINRYGSDSFTLLDNINCIEDLGLYFGGRLYQREVDYLIEKEWAYCLDDILFRRTKAGIKLKNSDKQLLASYISNCIKKS